MHSLMQLVCHSVQLRQPQPASYLGRVLCASPLFTVSLSVALTASTHILWPTVHHSYEQAAVSFSLSLSFCQLACREASIFISSSPAHCRELFVWPPFVICYFLLVIVWPADLHNNTHTYTQLLVLPHTHTHR